jgi:hypothetical protein
MPTIDTYTRREEPVRHAAATRLAVAPASSLVLLAQWMMATAPGHGRLDALAGPQVGGEETDPRRDGPVVPGEHANVAAAVL